MQTPGLHVWEVIKREFRNVKPERRLLAKPGFCGDIIRSTTKTKDKDAGELKKNTFQKPIAILAWAIKCE
jgi:hypothetical protein